MNELHTKKVLLLNASHNDERLLRALKKLGCYVITTGNRPELPGHKLADEYIFGDYTDKEEMLDLACKLHINAVCPCCNDFGVMTAAYVSEKLGFSGQDSYDTTLVIHNKDKFKAFIKNLGGISTPDAVSFNNINEAMQWVDKGNFQYPVIVKPVDLSAGNGICRANSIKELTENINKAFQKSRIGHIVVERFIEGTQHGFCTYLLNQKVVAICSNDEYSFINPYRVEIDTFPASNANLVTMDLVRQVERIAEALKLVDGIFHLQYIFYDGQAYIIECMRRVLGNLYSIPAEGLGAGFDWDYWEVRAKCGFGCDGFPNKYTQKGYWAYRALIAKQNGIYDGYKVPDDIKRYLYMNKMLYKSGHIITNYMSEPMGFLFFKFDTLPEMKKMLIDRYNDITVLIK